MKTCWRFKKDLVAYLSGNLDSSRSRQLGEHLKHCKSCEKELEEIKKIYDFSADFKAELKEVMETVEWGKLSADITERIWERKEGAQQRRALSWLYNWRWQPLTAGLILGLVLGALFTFVVIKFSQSSFPVAHQKSLESEIKISADFMERMDFALARKETVDYLNRSQYLLLDLLQSKRPEELSMDVIGNKIQQLLTEKKYLNNQLNDLRLLKAKAICDQIELLFLELSQLSPDLADKEFLKLRELIEKNQILLKINLVKKDLQQGEV